ncbi:MAG: AI-2E family transporter [Acidimicrobiia bacterium]
MTGLPPADSHSEPDFTVARAASDDHGRDRVIPWRSIWRVTAAVLATLATLWALSQMRSLVVMIVIALFLSAALEPAVRWLYKRRGWSRGTSVGVIYLAGIGFLLIMVLLLIPAMVELAQQIGTRGPEWAASFDDWSNDTLGVDIIDDSQGVALSDEAEGIVEGWASDAFGAISGIASEGAALVFSLTTIAMFTFYFTADSPRLIRIVLSWFKPETQEKVGWTLDEAITQTGGYFYSRTLLMVIYWLGFFITMVLVGMPVVFAIPLSVFGAFVSVFIPVIGTYLGAAVPILVTLAVQGLVAAIVVLAFVLIYQAIENAWLSPKISAETMNLSGGLAFASALAGGSLAGPVGAFLALPTAALISSFVSNYTTTYDVVYESASTNDDYEEVIPNTGIGSTTG